MTHGVRRLGPDDLPLLRAMNALSAANSTIPPRRPRRPAHMPARAAPGPCSSKPIPPTRPPSLYEKLGVREDVFHFDIAP